MEQRLKEIVSQYTHIPENEITNVTVIDRSAVSSSIILHRMYAKLTENGFNTDNYWDIQTFGKLLQQNNSGETITNEQSIDAINSSLADDYLAVGIDIEEISNLPLTDDFREHDFYKMNFAPSEISYCILKNDPYTSFAGLFAAKEALVKANPGYKNKAFCLIVIDHLPNGKPVHNNFGLTISHTKNVAVSVAILFKAPLVPDVPIKSIEKFNITYWLSFIAIIISLFAIIFSLNRGFH